MPIFGSFAVHVLLGLGLDEVQNGWDGSQSLPSLKSPFLPNKIKAYMISYLSFLWDNSDGEIFKIDFWHKFFLLNFSRKTH